MSSELKWLPMFQVGSASITSAVATPLPNQRCAASALAAMPSAPLIATHKRACHSPMPKAS